MVRPKTGKVNDGVVLPGAQQGSRWAGGNRANRDTGMRSITPPRLSRAEGVH